MLRPFPSSMHDAANTPAETVGACVARFPTVGSLPRMIGGSASALLVSRPARRSLALRPTCSLSRPRRPFFIGVLQPTSLPPSSAPTATGWSDTCRAGFAPAEEWRLRTAHDHAPLRAGLDDAHFQPAGRRVGQAARRHRRGHRAARPAPASRTRAQVRAAQLAHPGADHPGRVDGRRVTVGSRSDIAPASEGVRSFPPVAPALRSRAEDSRAANVNAHPDVVRARDGAASTLVRRNYRHRSAPPSPRAPDEPSAALEWSLDATPLPVRRRRPHRPAQPAVPSREGTPTGHDQHRRPARNPPGTEPERPSIRPEHYLADAVADQCARIHRLRLYRAADRFTGSVT